MKLAMTGKIIRIGNNGDYADDRPRATILLKEEDDETEREPMSLEFDLEEQEAKEIARHLFQEVRICIEIPPRPKIVE